MFSAMCGGQLMDCSMQQALQHQLFACRYHVTLHPSLYTFSNKTLTSPIPPSLHGV